MKKKLIVLLLLLAPICVANMASPIEEGTGIGAPFSSRDINILNEKIFVKLNNNFSTASFVVEYLINTETDGRQIPLLFYARDYKNDFQVFVDDREVPLLSIVDEYRAISKTPFKKFSNLWDKNDAGFDYNINDLKYFETNLTKGQHRIRVVYEATVWTDRSGWVKESSFRYSLAPAKYWKSFGSLEIVVDASAFGKAISSNLGNPSAKTLNNVYTWKFAKLPADDFEIIYTPAINNTAQILITIDPFGMMLVFAILMIGLHWMAIVRFRRKKPAVKYSWVVISGSLIFPFIILVSYPFYFGFIDAVIGDVAARHHGYTFMVIFLYPIIMPLYWMCMWLIDSKIKAGKKIKNVS